MIGGLLKTSFIDYPGKVSAVVFIRGCNFSCPYCHNPELVRFDGPEEDEAAVTAFLESRRGLLDGVVITGGEPCLRGERLLDFCRRIKKMGFPVKLDTNGSRPETLSRLVGEGLVDYLAMDLKTAPEDYGLVWRNAGPEDYDRIRTSVRIVMDSGLAHEFRTTCVTPMVDEARVGVMRDLIHGAALFVFQRCRPEGVLEPDFFGKNGKDGQGRPLTDAEIEGLRRMMRGAVGRCEIR